MIQIFEMAWPSLPWISPGLWVKGDENSLSGRTCRTFFQMKMGPGRKPSQKGSSLPSFQRYANIRESKKITTYKNRSSLHSVQTPKFSEHIPYFRGNRFVNAFLAIARAWKVWSLVEWFIWWNSCWSLVQREQHTVLVTYLSDFHICIVTT